MTYRVTYLALAGSVALLAGCGGGGSDSTVNTYAQMETDARALATGYIDPDTGAILPGAEERTNLPQSGQGSYEGYVGGDLEGEGLIGELSMTVNFGVGDTGTITGTADNFMHETQGAYTGALNLQNGTIVTGGSGSVSDGVAGDLTGTLSNGGNTYDTEINLEGVFLGGSGTDVPDAMAGGAVGEVGTGFFDGLFILTIPAP